ncbi:MAG: STAS domain-containing protein [Candidatus Odinarchaeia archaeon]
MSIEQLNNQNVVSFDVNKINILNSEEIETKLTNLIKNSKSGLTLNLSNVNFIDSTGFRMLSKLKSMLDIKLINISNDLQELFTLVSFN